MRKELYKKLCFLIVLLCIPLAMMGQGITVTGNVMDGVMNTGFPGATVTVKDTAIGQVTDLDGNYTITVPSKESVLVFSFLGYADQEVVVGNRTVIDVVLQEDNQTVDEVVVIAYGTQNKGLVTSAISSVGTKDLVKSPAASVTNMLAGSMPGVSAVQSTGQPGADAATIKVRGMGTLNSDLSAPLILVDGVEREFSQIDPNEIESISVLKDASSTAVFGVRGANGVILVTTRRGSVGAPSINVSSTLSLQQPVSTVHQVGSYEYAKFWNMRVDMDYEFSDIAETQRMKFTPEQVEAYRTGSDPIMYPSKDWMKEVFNDVFIQSKNNINISGGSENVKYFVSMGYLYQNGILKQMPGLSYDNNFRYNRYNYRANLDVKLSPTTKMKLGVGGYVGKNQQPYLNGLSTAAGSDGWAMILVSTHPFSSPGFINGVRTLVPREVTPIRADRLRDGWFAIADNTYGDSGGYQQAYNTNLNLDLDITQDLKAITKGLTLSIKGAYDSKFGLTKQRKGGLSRWQIVYYRSHFSGDLDTAPDYTMPETDPDFDKTYVYATGNNSTDTPLTYSETNSRAQSWYIEGRLNYERTFGDHRVSGLFLYNQSRNYYPASYSWMPRGYIGYVFRATYSYRNKYMADINMGYNGSENFAPGTKTRYGLFPAVSAGWVVSEEEFMQKQKVISYLKVRASFGRVGNDKSNSRFLYANTVWESSGGYSFGATNPGLAPGMAMSRYGNPDITWETADKQNYGLDIKFLDNRLSLSGDYFREHRTGILLTPNSKPGITAISWPFMNIGIVNNHGYELSLGWNDTAGKDFNYYVNANVSFARNKIIYMDEVSNEYDYMNYTGGSTGRRDLGLLYKFERLYQYSDFVDDGKGGTMLNPSLPTPKIDVRPGDAKYADLNGDGVIDSNDCMAMGYGKTPEYTFGLNAGFNWKGLSFSMQWVAALNVDRYIDTYYSIPYSQSYERGLLSEHYDNCWTYENQNGIYPRPSRSKSHNEWNQYKSDLWLMDASYIRLKNITLGYTFTDQALKKVGISSLAVTLSGYNLLTFSKLKFVDPESEPGNYSNGYPLVKLYSIGVNINF